MFQLNHNFSSLSDICLKFMGTLDLCETGIRWQTQIKIRWKCQLGENKINLWSSIDVSIKSLTNVSLPDAAGDSNTQASPRIENWDLEWELTGLKCRSQRHPQTVSRTGSTLNAFLATTVPPCSASQRAQVIAKQVSGSRRLQSSFGGMRMQSPEAIYQHLF